MKILTITTHWTTEEAECVYQLLDALKEAVWESYGDDITEMVQQVGVEQRGMDDDLENDVSF